ncbi:hypothetical protein [Rodentibacter myodis]|uniref:Uncharacterized protein n=1 Tax=Rodentibacter myodis TaxID=1907939 RepID=A0A1V3JM36_9PAST|nr:hypothetical protein [Rodentibacter myodis]OOF57292.1 hypothetical protein BKL49_09410 [Rodentibacter myodis]
MVQKIEYDVSQYELYPILVEVLSVGDGRENINIRKNETNGAYFLHFTDLEDLGKVGIYVMIQNNLLVMEGRFPKVSFSQKIIDAHNLAKPGMPFMSSVLRPSWFNLRICDISCGVSEYFLVKNIGVYLSNFFDSLKTISELYEGK